jgi:hypothetical protein
LELFAVAIVAAVVAADALGAALGDWLDAAVDGLDPPQDAAIRANTAVAFAARRFDLTDPDTDLGYEEICYSGVT